MRINEDRTGPCLLLDEQATHSPDREPMHTTPTFEVIVPFGLWRQAVMPMLAHHELVATGPLVRDPGREQGADLGTCIEEPDFGLGTGQRRTHEPSNRSRAKELAQVRFAAGLEIPAGIKPEEVHPLQESPLAFGHVESPRLGRWLLRVFAR